MRAHRGKLVLGAGPGAPVFAASFLPRREIVLDEALLDDAPQLVSIFAHEIYHFAWRRLSNAERASWADLLRAETRPKHGGYSSKIAYERYVAGNTGGGWKDYVCEAFCDSAAAPGGISAQRKRWLKNLKSKKKLHV